MSITAYITAFAELLEKGILIGQQDPAKNQQLLPADHSMHCIVAQVLRESLNSVVMAKMADKFHAEKQALQNMLTQLTAQAAPAEAIADAIVYDAAPAEDVEPAVEGENVPRETATPE